MLEQYVALRDEIEAQYPGAMLLFQCGDFYETFGEDAERAARLLNIALTHKSSKDFSTPMAGIPIRTLDSFVERLLGKGVCVAVAEQMELPGAGLVERKVTQLLTPGTVTEERHLTADENYLAAVATGDGYALAVLDVSTGEFRCAAFGSRTALYDELARWRTREVLLAPELSENPALLADFKSRFPLMLSHGNFEAVACREALEAVLGEVPGVLDGQGSAGLTRACGAVLGYARSIHAGVQGGDLKMVRRLNRFEPGAHMRLSDWALRALEIFTAQSPQGRTLMDALSETRTAGGRRRLRAWLRSPLLDRLSLQARLDAVETLTRASDLRGGVRALLYRAHDLERLSARVSSGRATPREVAALARTLELLPDAAELLGAVSGGGLLGGVRARLGALPDVVRLIRAALVDEPPIRISDGGLIREGFHAELDGLRGEALGHRAWLAELERSERERTGIGSLKVGYNTVFGYYLEVTGPHLSKVPGDYRQIATLKDRARFTRSDLREREREIARLEQAAERLEVEVFTELRAGLAIHADALSEAAGALSELDVLCALAEIAAVRAWSRPQTLEAGQRDVNLKQARHPVVELVSGGNFVPNDAELSAARRTLLLTGPNMAGKSTYLRTVAMCALLHQIGSFVPADEAHLPVFDSIHTRIGASDDLAGGRSTFMVEMHELAGILHHATPQSLIILDEVGRGTSTLDGLAIAQAALEHLHETGAYTLFATHYFELTRLEGQLPGLINLHVAAEEEAGALTFYHQVIPGAARQSYGVEVARLAGLPARVTTRAAALLGGLNAEKGDRTRALHADLAALDLTRLTPLDALALLHRWQAEL
ncbi:DNA mismatch repair protein MutS [Deinococcus irradiatisoli]|uniref:DNA mismatch repair protein MutS n=2 Tax=Deinococcus irradiatisoli TaxID=2202254 RepID=A0A2Z3JLW1_9DEIO|nr:DNA mismatch repair protein MutS [Deinococcus irradiatisoli]